MGERTPLASVNAPASGRMAIGEALTNIAAANIRSLSEVKLSANWMAAAGHPGDDAALYATVKAIGMELCPALGISIPVGKDSMSMKTVWQDDSGTEKSVTAPVSCVISAFAPVADTAKTLTPVLQNVQGSSSLFLLDLAAGKQRLACSALAQVYQQVGQETPDVDDAALLKRGVLAINELVEKEIVDAYHDRSDGGLIAALAEMSFASRCGLNLDIATNGNALEILFNEELGAVLQVSADNLELVQEVIERHELSDHLINLGAPRTGDEISVTVNGEQVLNESRTKLHRTWSATTFEMQKLRDNPQCAQEEYDAILDNDNTGLFAI
jgi:phosphoribosylformylglycinamidine synthase